LLPDNEAKEKLPGIVNGLLSDKAKLKEMREKTLSLAIYDAAARICDEVHALAK
jgi:UDP-N-acetylglucosamine:LPS N-acetylglucosamine transferase